MYLTLGNPAITNNPNISDRAMESGGTSSTPPIIMATVDFHSLLFESKMRHSATVAAPDMLELRGREREGEREGGREREREGGRERGRKRQ